MLRYFKQKRGQSTLEYAILIVIVIGALLGAQGYLKHSLAGGIVKSADDIGDQYSVGNENAIKITNRSSNSEDTFNAGTSVSNLISESSNTAGNRSIINGQYEYWGN